MCFHIMCAGRHLIRSLSDRKLKPTAFYSFSDRYTNLSPFKEKINKLKLLNELKIIKIHFFFFLSFHLPIKLSNKYRENLSTLL